MSGATILERLFGLCAHDEEGPVAMHAFMTTIARLMAYVGGFVLTGLILITGLSVLGRELSALGHSAFLESHGFLSAIAGILKSFGPINGDFEIVEAGVAFAIMACIPWCQLQRGHAKVELFTAFLPDKANRFLALLWEALFAFVLIIIAWRLYVGMTDKMRFGETSFMLQFPIWWGYAACTFAAVTACIVALYSVWQYAQDLRLSDDDASSELPS